MREAKKYRFQLRAFVSVLTMLSFVTLAISGTILFITPPGRIAHWTGWRFWGLTKAEWSSIHIWFALIFLFVAGIHIYYNWRPLVSYFKTRLTKKFSLRREWLFALVLCVGIFIGTLAELPPFSSLLAWDDQIKLGWADPQEEAPIPHAELLSLAELAKEINMDVNTMLDNLHKQALRAATPDSVVGDTAKAKGLTPNQFYKIAVGAPKRSGTGHTSGAGLGFGKLTLEEFCRQEKVQLDIALETLQNAGIEAQPDMKLRDIALNNNRKPYQILEIIKGI